MISWSKILKAIWRVLGWVYFPVYCMATLIYVILWVLLGLVSYLCLDATHGHNILKFTFKFLAHGRSYGEKVTSADRF